MFDNHTDFDMDAREAEIRARAYEQSERWETAPEERDMIVATYYVHARVGTLHSAGKSISYHMTSGAKNPPLGSLLEACTGRLVDVMAWNAQETVGLVRVAFPLKMFERADGLYYTTDLLHILGGAGVFALWEFSGAKLIHINLPEMAIATFPGPAHGAHGVRKLVGYSDDEPAFGTILKPTSGITDQDVGRLVGAVACNPLFMFIKEDENLLPELPYCHVLKRTQHALEAIARAMKERAERPVIFCPHLTCPPERMLEIVERVFELGVNGIMFSEQYVGGMVRAVRKLTLKLDSPPVIYGHNGGITSKTISIWSEVLDFLARLDGIDFRQTAPCTLDAPLLRPQGVEWRKCEQVLSMPLGPIKPVMVTRAGGLDQGNIIMNLDDAKQTLPSGQVMFLAGSAINSITDSQGNPAPALGSAAMSEAVELWRTGNIPNPRQPLAQYVSELVALARGRGHGALCEALEQRYPQLVKSRPVAIG